MPKYLILKFENLFINSYNAYSGTASNYDENIKNVVINNCDNCYANYVRYSNINSGTNRSTNNSSQSSHNNRKYYDSSKKTQEAHMIIHMIMAKIITIKIIHTPHIVRKKQPKKIG